MKIFFLQGGLDSWKEILWGSEDWSFIWTVLLKSAIMFIIVLAGLRIFGRRGIRQLSVSELVIILALGSAASDPMIYTEMGIATALVAFVVVIGLYKLITYFVIRNESFERIVEGDPIYLVQDGMFCAQKFEKQRMANDEFFMEMRTKGASHLGQIELAVFETNGEISIFFYPDEEVKYGLPILPHLYFDKNQQVEEAGKYACAYCGKVDELKASGESHCSRCNRTEWVKAINKKRIG